MNIAKKELADVLKKHSLWLMGDPNGERTNLRKADLRGTYLYEAYLRGANLYEAYLRGADLRGADLRGAYLRGANLYEADLCGANLCGANLCGANLYLAAINWPIACPEKGEFIAFKKAGCCIIELVVCEDAKRSSATTRKCRCSKAKVISITNIDGSTSTETSIPSDRDENFIYTIGETVEVPDFDDDRWNECSTGIHFFITRQEAVEY